MDSRQRREDAMSPQPPPPPPQEQQQQQQQHLQDAVLRRSLDRPDEFWARQAERLVWHTAPTAVLRRTRRGEGGEGGTGGEGGKGGAPGGWHGWEWFPGGRISTCHNCVDRHVEAGRGDAVALYYDSPVTKTKERYTFARLQDEVEVLATALRDEAGVRRGDVVMLYMPMVPAAVVGMLAANRLGAVHAVVFGGFAAAALAARIDACRPAVLLTASCGIDGAKPPVAYRPLVEEAVALAAHPPRCVLVWQRAALRWAMPAAAADAGAGATVTASWQAAVRRARAGGRRAACVPVASTDAAYLLHTSGTTGAPKGVVRDAGGHAVGLLLAARFLLGVGEGDVVFAASDVGWVVGHSMLVYAPLLAGAATVLYEGKPVGTPDAGALWRVAAEYRVSVLFTAPTALRAVRLADPHARLLRRVGAAGGLRALRALFLAGERSEPALVAAYQDLLARYAAPAAQVVDNWWSTESGSPITGRALAPRAAALDGDGGDDGPAPLRPGSAGKPMPGFDVRVVDDAGAEVAPGATGNIVLGLPLAPTAFRTLWADEDRFYASYLRRFGGRWLDTGDAGRIDADGYVHVMGRNDDVLNVSAHRLSSGSIEQALTAHPLVAEACVVGVPDALKGQQPFAFITLTTTPHPAAATPDARLTSELQALVRRQVGGIAALGGVVQGVGVMPRTRSGKTLRRVLRELVANAARGQLDGPLVVPSTVEDAAAVDAARAKLREYWLAHGARHAPVETPPAGPKL